MLFTLLQSAWGYSAIWNIDGWDAARLKKAGISVTSWKHDQIGEDPALNWVQITYDTSMLAADQNVLMTLHVITQNGQTISASRAERKKNNPNILTILFAIHKESIKKSYVNILVPKLLSEGAKREYGNPGFGGYSLRLSRIIELADKSAVDKPLGINKK